MLVEVVSILLISVLCETISASECKNTGACSIDDKNLDCYRQDIDVFTDVILEAVNQRTIVAGHVAKWKIKNKRPIYDPAREKIVLDKIVKKNEGPLSDDAIRQIFQIIMNETTKYEGNMTKKPGKYRCPPDGKCENLNGFTIANLVMQIIILILVLYLSLQHCFKNHRLEYSVHA
ncbi:uncharacterized protein LOC141900212 [Tubulanus polymorphus]|uniref:uncharacterized protein LOC141900212 n=1 Tax=Tubulanus polymorphus TaxID=672921 RepID=UPI003DA54A0F